MMKPILACVLLLSCLAVAPLHAVNEGLWMGDTYSVALKYLGVVEKGVDAPFPKSVQMPDYPLQAMKAAVGGEVILVLLVTADGTVAEVTVEKSTFDSFADASKAAAMKWTFSPANLRQAGAKAVPAHLRCRFEFSATEK